MVPGDETLRGPITTPWHRGGIEIVEARFPNYRFDSASPCLAPGPSGVGNNPIMEKSFTAAMRSLVMDNLHSVQADVVLHGEELRP